MFGYHTWCRSHLQCYHLPSDRMSLWCPNPSFIFKKICNIETYVLTNQCCKVTLVKTMLLTSNLNVLPPTQRRLVFFFISSTVLCVFWYWTHCVDPWVHISVKVLIRPSSGVLWCWKRKVWPFKAFNVGHGCIIRFVLCVCLFMEQSVLLLYIINGCLGVVWKRHGFEVEALKVLWVQCCIAIAS